MGCTSTEPPLPVPRFGVAPTPDARKSVVLPLPTVGTTASPPLPYSTTREDGTAALCSFLGWAPPVAQPHRSVPAVGSCHFPLSRLALPCPALPCPALPAARGTCACLFSAPRARRRAARSLRSLFLSFVGHRHGCFSNHCGCCCGGGGGGDGKAEILAAPACARRQRFPAWYCRWCRWTCRSGAAVSKASTLTLAQRFCVVFVRRGYPKVFSPCTPSPAAVSTGAPQGVSTVSNARM